MATAQTQALLEPQLGEPAAAELVSVLAALQLGAGQALGDSNARLLLVGSFAMGYGDRHSDVDFVVVTDLPVTPEQETALRALHQRLPDLGSDWASHLEGSYAPAPDLANPTTLGRKWLYVDNGSREMEMSAHDNTAHSRWVLREHGHVVHGPAIRDRVATITADMLRAEAIGEAHHRAAAWEDEPSQYANAWIQPYAVLTMCRMLFTACEGRVTGKVAAATWALDQVPERFHTLVRAAIDSRPDPWGRVHRTVEQPLADQTRAFVWELVGLITTP